MPPCILLVTLLQYSKLHLAQNIANDIDTWSDCMNMAIICIAEKASDTDTDAELDILGSPLLPLSDVSKEENELQLSGTYCKYYL